MDDRLPDPDKVGAERQSSASLIDCLVLSTGRAASTAIYRYLDMAGELHLPINKEPHHWCDVRRHAGLYEGLLNIYTEDAAAYRDLYSQSKLKVDASCGYFFYIDEVIRNLRDHGQQPRAIFLYREPVSRAASFFNELKKKNLTAAETLAQDLARNRSDGLWWEYYYDNVRYDYCFGRMQEFFSDIIAVNYDYFAQNQGPVLKALLEFLDLPADRIEGLDLEPVNTSSEALSSMYLRRHPLLGAVGKSLPSWLKKAIQVRMGRRLGDKQSEAQADGDEIRRYLPNSLLEYERFRQRIGNRDLLVLKSQD